MAQVELVWFDIRSSDAVFSRSEEEEETNQGEIADFLVSWVDPLVGVIQGIGVFL